MKLTPKMQKLNGDQGYGSITSAESQNEFSHQYSGKPSSTPLTLSERVDAVSTAGSEYYISLASVTSCNSSKEVVCFRIDESGSPYMDSCHTINYHGENYDEASRKMFTNWSTAKTIRATVRKSCDSFLLYLGFKKNPVLPSSTSASSLASTANISSSSREDSLENDTSPLMHPHQTISKSKAPLYRRNSSYADVRLSMVSNFSAAYNTTNVSLALTLMKSLYPPDKASDVYVCSSALIAGMIIGQLGGGLLGDWLGRHAAMAVVMSLQVAAAFGSGWVGWIGFSHGMNESRNHIYSSLAGKTGFVSPFHDIAKIKCLHFTQLDLRKLLQVWRLLLGVGCGGVYPLAASIAAESSSAKEDRGKLVALTFSMQGVGYLAVSLVALILVWLLGEESDIAWRLLLGFGCIPGLALICFRVHRRKAESADIVAQHSKNITISKATDDLRDEHHGKEKTRSTVRLPPISLLQQIRNEPNLARKIIGTAGCWLLFDILFYGNTLFQPVVLSAAFGTTETVLATIRDSTMISLMALPGYFVSVLMVGKHQTPKAIQLQGFLVMSILYTLIGVYFSSLARHRILLITLYGMTFFFSNYGPNSTVSNSYIDIQYSRYSKIHLITFVKPPLINADIHDAEHDLLSSV